MKINSCFIFALFLLVSLAIAIETSQHETINKEAKGAKVEPAYGGGGNWGGGGGGGNWGGGGGGGCRYGCCYRGYRGCQRCCASLEEAKASPEKQETMSTEAKGAAEGNKVEPEATEANKVEPAGGGGGNWGGGGGGGNWGGGGCRHGCCYQGYRGCQRCCASPEEAKALAEKQDTMSKEAKTEANKVGPEEKGAGDQAKVEPAGGGGGNWGGGGGGGNWGGGGGGGCRYGCCYRGYRGCQRCCASLDEAKALTEKQHHP